MLAEGADETDVRAWQKIVKGLRYKDYQSMRAEEVRAGLSSVRGGKPKSRRCDDMKEWTAILEKEGILGWWKEAMGYAKEG